jgi:hypothetical protein
VRFFAVGQRVRISEMFEASYIFASGYVVDTNGIDILDAWWALRLPNWVYEYDWMLRRWSLAQKILMHSRSRGFFIHLEFDRDDF